MFSKQSIKVKVSAPQPTTREQGINKKKELDELAAETLRRVIDSIDDKIELDKLDAFQKRQFTEQVYDTLVALLEERNRHLSQGDKQKVIQYVLDEIFGYGPLNSLLNDPTVTEIMVNGCDNIYVEKDGKIIKTDITFRNDEHVLHAINKIITPLGRRIDESSPAVDARLPDGSRLNAIIPPLALKGPSLTIRKFSADPFTVEDLIQMGTLTREMAMFLKACVRARINMIVTGGTGSGKTTTLNVLSSFIPETERIVTIEDTAELQLYQDHVVTLESRPANSEGRGEFTIRELVINSLRMRPDRIVIGEVRGGEALDMLQAMNTGHSGSISTLHANNPRDALSRLETMVLMAGMELPLKAIREQINSAIELIVHQTRFSDGSRRITQISEVVGIKDDSICLQDIFLFQQSGLDELGNVQGSHKITGIVPRCLEKLKACGEFLEAEEIIPEWKKDRETFSAVLPPSWEGETEKAEEKAPSGMRESIAVNSIPDQEKAGRSVPVGQSGNVIALHLENKNTGREGSLQEVEPEQNNSPALPSEQWNDTAPSPKGREKGKDSERLPLNVPPALRGMAIPVNRTTGLFSYLAPGDRVDVLVIYGKEDDHRNLSASIAVNNALVLATGENCGKEPSATFPESSVLLAVTPEQAQRLACDCLKGSFHLILCPNTTERW